MLDEYSGATYTRLAAMGIGFDSTGKMTLDDKTFEAAMKAAPTAVQALFSSSEGSGAFGAIAALVQDYTEAGGLVASARQRLTDQVSSISNRLTTLESHLEIRRQALQKEFMAADLAMNRLNAQSASLSSLGGQFRLF